MSVSGMALSQNVIGSDRAPSEIAWSGVEAAVLREDWRHNYLFNLHYEGTSNR
jgi:hypothetical protein